MTLLLLSLTHTHATSTFLRRQQSTKGLRSDPVPPLLDPSADAKLVANEEKEDDQLDAQEALAMEKEAGETLDKATAEQDQEETEASETTPNVSNDAFQSLDAEPLLVNDGPIPEPAQFPIQPKAATAATGGIAAIFGNPVGDASTGGSTGSGATGAGSTGSTGSTGSSAGTGTTGGTGSTGMEQGLDLNDVEVEVSDEKRLSENIKALLNGSPRVQKAYAKFQKAARAARQVLDEMQGLHEMESMMTGSTGATGATGSGATGADGATGEATGGATGSGVTGAATGSGVTGAATGEASTTGNDATGDETSFLEVLLKSSGTGSETAAATAASGSTGGGSTGSGSTGGGSTGSSATGPFVAPVESSDAFLTCTQLIAPTLFGIHQRIAKDYLAAERVANATARLPADMIEVDALMNDARDAESVDVEEALLVCNQKCPFDPKKQMGVMEKFLAKIAKLKEQCGPQLEVETQAFVGDLKQLVQNIDDSIAGDGKNASLLSKVGMDRAQENIKSIKDSQVAAEKRRQMLKE